MDKKTLGFYYGFIDACMVMLLLAGYFWVNSFIKDEFEGIKRNTVTAAGALLYRVVCRFRVLFFVCLSRCCTAVAPFLLYSVSAAPVGTSLVKRSLDKDEL